MARIAGVNIPLNKRVEIGLTSIFGVGRSRSNEVLEKTGIPADTYVKDLTDDEIIKLREAIDNELVVEGDLRRERSQDIKRLTETGDLPGPASSPRAARPRTAHEDQRARPQGPAPWPGRAEAEGVENEPEEGRLDRAASTQGSRGRRRVRKNIPVGQAHIKTSFNNTIVTLTDREGNVIAWESAGGAGFKGSRKSTPFAAQVTAEAAAKKGMEHGLQKVEVLREGPRLGT